MVVEIALPDSTVRIPDTGRMIALVALYNATGGPDWTENTMWLTGAPRGEWHGVVTDDDDRVVELRLAGNGLGGPIPPEMSGLASLRVLDLSANGLTGPIPPETGELANLERLYLYENDLTGSLPPELGKLVNLTVLDLFSNGLTGPVPPEFGNLAALEYIYLAENGLTGLVPPEVGKLGNLKILDLSANGLRGPVPPEVAELALLEAIVLEDNSQMSGEARSAFPAVGQRLGSSVSGRSGAARAEESALAAAGAARLHAWWRKAQILAGLEPKLGRAGTRCGGSSLRT